MATTFEMVLKWAKNSVSPSILLALLLIATPNSSALAKSFPSCKSLLSFKLTPEEREAVRGYTGGKYIIVNQFLRGRPLGRILSQFNGDTSKITKDSVEADIATINSALNKLKAYQGTVYRVLGSEGWGKLKTPGLSDRDILLEERDAYKRLLSHFRIGKTFKDPAFVSTSLNTLGEGDAALLNSFVILKIESRSGRRIDQYSHEPHEIEILFPSGTAFEVTNVEGYWQEPIASPINKHFARGDDKKLDEIIHREPVKQTQDSRIDFYTQNRNLFESTTLSAAKAMIRRNFRPVVTISLVETAPAEKSREEMSP